MPDAHDRRKDLSNNLATAEAVFARRPFGLLTDYDGTIAETAPSPDLATVNEDARALLGSLAPRVAVLAVVSGRPASQVERMAGVAGAAYFGVHGLESRERGRTRRLLAGVRRTRAHMAEVVAALHGALAGEPGIMVENKGITVSVHYRAHPRPAEIAPRVLAEASRLATPRGLAVRQGKMLVEVRPSAASKGTVVRRLVRRHSLAGVLYIGDDDTDIDAFEALRALEGRRGFRGLSVAVTGPEAAVPVLAAADLHVDGVEGVVELLRRLDGMLA